jgi:hypothetical protein
VGLFNLTQRTAGPVQNVRAALRQGQTQTVKSAIVALMAHEEAIRREHELLATEMQRYFLETCPALTARWKTAIVGVAPPVLRELARRLQALEAVTNETNRELKASHVAPGEGRESAEHLLDRALASMEHLREVAEEMMRRLDELLA